MRRLLFSGHGIGLFVVFGFFGVLPALADSYTERQLGLIVEQSMAFVRQDFLFYDESKDAQCRKEIKEMMEMKLAWERGEALEEKMEETICLDKHSALLTPREARERNIQTSGTMVGIGVTVRMDAERLVVLGVMDGSPADDAGILPGDVLLRGRNEDDDSFLEFKELQSSVEKIRGAEGSALYLFIERDGVTIKMPYLKRAEVETPSLSVKEFDDIGYISIEHFSKRTGDELEAAVKQLAQKGIGRLVIDLRDNPGGAMLGVLETLYYWNPRPDDIMTIKRFRDEEKVQTIRDPFGQCADDDLETICATFSDPKTGETKRPGGFGGFKIVILINKMSASASELFAGVMKDWGDVQNKVTLVGEPTYGNGVGQSVLSLPFGFSLALTTFEYLVGNAKTKVNGIGIFPHYLLDDTRESAEDTLGEKDQQWRQARTIVREM